MKSSSFSIFSKVSQILRHGRLPLAASALMIAWRNDPAPLSAVLPERVLLPTVSVPL